MAEDLQILKKRRQLAEGQGLASPVSATEQRRAAGETRTPEGFNMIDTALTQRGARQSPERYSRG